MRTFQSALRSTLAFQTRSHPVLKRRAIVGESERETKAWILRILGCIGPAAEPAVPMVLRALAEMGKYPELGKLRFDFCWQVWEYVS
jgi:hypothetical protein